jgi:hypothetical protein
MGRPRKNVDAVEVLRLRLQGLSWRQIAARTNLGLGTVFRAQKSALNSLAAFQNRKSRYLEGGQNCNRPTRFRIRGNHLVGIDDFLLFLLLNPRTRRCSLLRKRLVTGGELLSRR